jgi:predicted amidophosphoribosyltransferase
MGRLMANLVIVQGITCVSHVPLHPKRMRERGYDQSAKLAHHLARSCNLTFRPDLLRRTRQTKQQALLPRSDRPANVAGAFLATRELRDHTILLVDDVSTTGATMLAAGHALREGGADRVVGVVFAHSHLDDAQHA